MNRPLGDAQKRSEGLGRQAAGTTALSEELGSFFTSELMLVEMRWLLNVDYLHFIER